MDTVTLIVKCPHCGAEKKVASSKEKWYNLHYTFWSDSRIESDEFCEPGHTQQCPACGKFMPIDEYMGKLSQLYAKKTASHEKIT